MTIEPMQASDLDAVHTLLRANKLPLDDFDAHLGTALVARDEGRVVGTAALELYAPYALLRSVAVDASLRGQGLGQLLTSEALALARRRGMSHIYLLTATAAAFFPKFGFAPVGRTEVPEEVQRSVEFTTACPASAQAMMLNLAPGVPSP